MPRWPALIVIDSGYSQTALERSAARVVGICDVYKWRTASGAPFVDAERLASFAGDPMNHGSIVLEKLATLAPEAPIVLVRAYGPDVKLIRTTWEEGRQAAPGWTEGYLWAVTLCKGLGLASVANCSFGGFTHAMDGTGWESFQLGQAIGSGKPGHALVAAAGPGDGRATHAAWVTLPGEQCRVEVLQKQTSSYNLWASGLARQDWLLEVWHGDRLLRSFAGQQVPLNFWNQRQQLTFSIEGSGEILLKLACPAISGHEESAGTRFDCWIEAGAGASFLNHVDPTLIAEPAVFPQVISVGLQSGSYAASQSWPDGKPDVLLPDGGVISFRLPEVTAAVATVLAGEPELDVDGVRARLGKYPRLPPPGF